MNPSQSSRGRAFKSAALSASESTYGNDPVKTREHQLTSDTWEVTFEQRPARLFAQARSFLRIFSVVNIFMGN